MTPRSVQMLRRSEGFEVADRIRLEWASDDPSIIDAFNVHDRIIAGEVLAVTIERADSLTAEPSNVNGADVAISIEGA